MTVVEVAAMGGAATVVAVVVAAMVVAVVVAAAVVTATAATTPGRPFRLMHHLLAELSAREGPVCVSSRMKLTAASMFLATVGDQQPMLSWLVPTMRSMKPREKSMK